MSVDADKLVDLVAKMRELGVTEYSDGTTTVRLGAAPPPKAKEKTKDELLKEIEDKRRRHHETQFAACHVIPSLRLVK